MSLQTPTNDYNRYRRLPLCQLRLVLGFLRHPNLHDLLAEGGQLEDPAGFVKRLNALMLALGTK